MEVKKRSREGGGGRKVKRVEKRGMERDEKRGMESDGEEMREGKDERD